MRKKQEPMRARPQDIGRIERPLTLVAQVEHTLRRAVTTSVFPGGRLPTTVDLAEQLGVSRETVRLALEVLQGEGLLVKYRRRGTFIEPPARCGALTLTPSKIVGYLQEEYGAEQGESEVVTRATSHLMFHGALAEAGEAGYQMIVRSATLLRLRDAFDQLKSIGPLCGVLLASVAEEKFMRSLSGLDIPAVLLDHDLHVPNLGSIRGDSAQNARLAVEHLVGLGHRRIACAYWRLLDHNPWFCRGYRKGLNQSGIRCRRAWEFSVDLTAKGAATVVDRLLPLSPRPTALVCFHNTFAHQVIEAARGRGLKVPEQLSVVGGGGEEVVGLTCNQLDWHELGRDSMRILLHLLSSGKGHRPEHKVVPYTLRIGTTTQAPSEEKSERRGQSRHRG